MADINKINLFGTTYNVTDEMARSAASFAQEAASQAQTAADTAQKAASQARTAADTAQEGVDTLKESQINVSYSEETLNFTKGV